MNLYEKKYNEAQKWIESIYSELSHEQQMEAEAFFPELKESEDERIRKRIIHALHGDVLDMEETTKAISWLEKQGEPEDMGEVSDGYHTFNELYYYRMLYNAAFFNRLPKDWVHKSKRHHDGEECFGGGWFIVMANLPTGQISNHYELKDWDLFQIPEKDIADEWDGHTPQEAAERLHKFLLEKQGEQKPIDKVEPKFKVGDWVIDKQGIVHQISNVIENVTNHTYGYDVVDGGYFNDSTEGVKLWTIQDAKDGDVLCVKYGNDKMPFIFTGKQDNVAYCALNSFGEFVLSIAEWLLKISVLPATKEQHDTLFAKMKEAGYEWDAEKKELKKISQRMVSAEAKEVLYNKPTWSEDDVYNSKLILSTINQDQDLSLETKDKLTSWLKSIRPQPKQEWEEENIEELTEFENTMMHIGGSFFGENAGLDPNDTAMIKEQAKLLLELAPKTEWNEEDEHRINRISDFIWKNRKGDTDEIYQQEQDVNWLKSFIPQKQWKPSNVQMQALKEACDIYWEPDGSDALYTLYEQLKKLTE